MQSTAIHTNSKENQQDKLSSWSTSAETVKM